MLERLPIDLIVEIGILAGPDEYEELAKTSKRNAIILQKPYIVRATSELIVKVTYSCLDAFLYQNNYHSFNYYSFIGRYYGKYIIISFKVIFKILSGKIR